MENFNDSKALAIEIAKILDKKKAHDVRVLKVESLTVLTDYFVIASGTSTTQVASLADEVEFELSQKGLEPYNPVLDTLLTAKSMDCQQRGINMTSVADGSQLGFLSTRELCTLVGAPLDNAIESVMAEPDPEKRLLRVAIYNQSGCVMLRFENYCAQPVEMGADGLPVHNAHGGYDLQGVQAAARRHDGTMTLHWADGWFTLRILLPVPS